MASADTYRPEVLIVDTNALLSDQALKLGERADRLMTVPEVIAEVRSETARRMLQIAPVEIPARVPSAEALAHVTAFAKATGDLPSLSKPDLLVLALTYMMEKEVAGSVEHLRATPTRPTTVIGAGPPSATAAASSSSTPPVTGPSLPGFYMPDADAEQDDSKAVEEDDDSAGWITPKSVQAARRDHMNAGVTDAAAAATPSTKVACITSDFAMQNVLLQMGITVQTSDGKRITEARSYVLRCHACFKWTADMSKHFCPSCGNATLIKTSVSVGADGQLKLHLKQNFQYRLRGTKFAIPDQQGGKHTQNLVLREDQKEYQKAVRMAQKEQKSVDVFDVEYDMPMNTRESTRAKQQMRAAQSQGVKIGHGRKNPNEKRRSRK